MAQRPIFSKLDFFCRWLEGRRMKPQFVIDDASCIRDVENQFRLGPKINANQPIFTSFQNTVIVAPEFAFDCSSKGIFGHDSDCAKFWLCKSVDGNPELYKCPAGYLFNNEERRCVEEDQVECDKKMDMVMLRAEAVYVNQLKVSQLASFFYRYASL